MQWLILLLLVTALLVPTVMLWGFAGCGKFGSDGESGISAPVSLKASGTSDSTISVSWTYPPPPATPPATPPAALPPTAFIVFRGTPGPMMGPEVGEIAVNTGPKGGPPNYMDTTLPDETTFIYRVKASTDGGGSDFSIQTSATTLPRAPTALTLSVQSSSQINLAWTKNSKTSRFQIEHRSPPGTGSFTKIGEVSAVAYNHAGLTAGSSHEYRVAAMVDGFIDNSATPVLSAYSNSVQGTTTPPAPPSFNTAFPKVGTPQPAVNTPQPGVEKFCIVQRIDHSLLSNSGTQIRITLKGPPPGTKLTIDAMYVSQVAPSGDPYDSPPAIAPGGLVRLVDKNVTGVSLQVPPAGALVGPVPFKFDPTQDLLIAFDISDDAGTMIRDGAFNGATSYARPNTDQAATADRTTGFTSAVNNLYLITLIEVA